MLIAAIVLISLALVGYTTGVWAERLSTLLRPAHAWLFALGFLFDGSGTYLMWRIAQQGTASVASATGGVLMSVMAITGQIALILMALHLAWALIVLVRNRPNELATFHRLSIVVWAVWLVPYLTGMVGAML